MRHGASGRFSEWVRGRLVSLQSEKHHDDEESPKPAHGHWNNLQGRHGGGVGRFMIIACKGSDYASRFSCSCNPVVAVMILTALWVGLYSGSLLGGDLHTVVAHLGRIGACFFSAIACFLAAFCIAVFTPTIARRVRTILLAIIVASWNLMFLYDHGGSLRHHGAYNMLVFVVFVLPALAIAGLEYALWRLVGWRRLLAVHLPVVIVGAFATTISLHKANHGWDRGFRGERISPFRDQSSICTPVDRGLPWVDILPGGAQNFWAGTLKCGTSSNRKAAKTLDFHVNFTIDGALTVTCNAAAATDTLTYTPLPSTLDWPKADKLIEETFEGAIQRPFNKNVMDKVRLSGEVPCTPFQPFLLPSGTEVVIIRCGAVEKLVTRVRPTAKALTRTSPSSSIATYASNITNPKLDVVVIFLDATSRRGFHRRLRKTVSALEDADASGVTRLYQFFRYNIVGFSTEPNSRAMFQGMSTYGDADWIPPIWEDFANSGWVTLFTADTCQDLNAAYLNRKAREDRRCFDHELVSPFCHSDFFAEDSNPFGNFRGPYSITARCLKGQHVHEHELHYLHSFPSAYPDRAKFSLAWFLEGHEGTTEVLRHLDDAFADYVKTMDWNRTALIIAADHGLHMGLNFGLSRNGAVEHRNPMLAVLLPPWFADQKNRHEVMRKNQQRLVTGLDLYRTLQGIRVAGSDRDVIEGEQLRSKSGIDLLRNEVPETRTCKDAAIPEKWCQCL